MYICIIVGCLSMLSFKAADPFHLKIEAYTNAYLQEMLQLTQGMNKANQQGDIEEVKAQFFEARVSYKRIEAILAYFFSESAWRLNGPNLLDAEPSMPGEYKYPTGFQVMEEHIFSDDYDVHLVRNEIDNIEFYIKKVQQLQRDVTYTQSNILDALKLNLFNMMSKGIAGFDSPVILNSVAEAKETLEGTRQILAFVHADAGILAENIVAAQAYLDDVTDFNSFDRATFLTQYMNPITRSLVSMQQLAQIPFDTLLPKLIAPDAATMFDYSKWNIFYFAPSDALPLTQQNIAIGQQLFFDNRLSVNLQRNCGTCHEPSKDFTDGLATNMALLGDEKILRNTPTLINAGWQASQFYDKRVAYLEDQIHDVVTNEQEMGQAFDVLLGHLNKDKALVKAAKKATGNNKITERDVKRFLAAYIRSLNNFQTPFDLYMQGQENAMSAAAKRGFNLFMGKAKCGTCHFMPLFNGSLPPYFDKIETEILGVPIAKDKHEIDTDLGAYNIYKIDYQKYAFKTPTVRGVSKTAPYMHNGVYNTLQEVINFYNHGGGAGIGIELEFQTLPPDSLNLSDEEQKDIEVFLKAL